MLAHAKAENLVALDKFCKKHKAISVCLSKVLLNSLLHPKQQCGAIAMNDTKGCFDHIVHTIVIMVLLSFGMSSVATRTLFETLQKVDHHIKTGYGVSTVAYGNGTFPTQGTKKGNSNRPTVWGLISLNMIAMMKNKGHGVYLCPLYIVTITYQHCMVLVCGQHRPPNH